jgi:hypothetical protein
MVFVREDTGVKWWVALSNNDFRVYSTASSNILFGINGSNVDTGNKVGIGIFNPTAKLHVSGSQSSPLIIASGSTTVDMVRITQTGTGNAFVVEDGTNPDTTQFVIDNIGNVGIGVTGPAAKLHVLGGTSSPVFKVDGTSGELFTINDSLTGSLFSVNDISGLPILEVFDDNSVIIGDYQAPSLYTTKKVITSSNGVNNIYSFATASWSSAYVDYNISNAGNYRAGTLVAVFGPAGVEFTEISTLDIGNTTTGAYSLTFSFVLSGTYSILRSTTSITNWNIKTIIRSI